MKKQIGSKAMAALLASVLFLASCGSPGQQTGASAGQTGEGQQSGSSAEEGGSGTAGGYGGGSYKISLGHVCSENHTIHQVSLAFKEEVEAKSDGKITVQIHPNSELGGDEAMLESVALGTLTMVIPSATMLSSYVPEFDILGMPYLFKDTDTAFATIDGGLGELLDQKLAAAGVGLTNLGYDFNGIRNMTNSRKPIRTPGDLSGLKMRCMSNEIFVQMFQHLGANATPMSWSELFTALQQGTVDGQENPASLIYEAKFQEVQSQLSTTEHIYDFCAVIIGSSFYEGLDDEAREIVTSAAEEILVKQQRVMETSQNEEYLKRLEESGMEITRLSADERAAFAEKVQPMYENWETKYGSEITEVIEKFR